MWWARRTTIALNEGEIIVIRSRLLLSSLYHTFTRLSTMTVFNPSFLSSQQALLPARPPHLLAGVVAVKVDGVVIPRQRRERLHVRGAEGVGKLHVHAYLDAETLVLWVGRGEGGKESRGIEWGPGKQGVNE
jgi:hypothetical protein